jgi:hypothetical protein
LFMLKMIRCYQMVIKLGLYFSSKYASPDLHGLNSHH